MTDDTTSDSTSSSDSTLHDMGGNIGPASVRGSSAPSGGGASDDAAPQSGYSEDAGPMAGRDEEQPQLAGSDESGTTIPTIAGAPSLIVDIDEAGDQTGRGADGDTAARLQQQQEQGSR